MNEEKFTPGPWVSEIHRINTPNEQSVGFFVRTITDKQGERRQISGYVETYNQKLFKEIEANAALIAAAPEMYGILEHYLDLIQRANDGDTVAEQKIFEQAADIEKVLNKARGEE